MSRRLNRLRLSLKQWLNDLLRRPTERDLTCYDFNICDVERVRKLGAMLDVRDVEPSDTDQLARIARNAGCTYSRMLCERFARLAVPEARA
jgi:hypothetical protein